MIKRSNFLTALICIILSLVCAFSIVFAGCAEYIPPENQGGNPVDPVDPDDPAPPADENTKDFSVQLVTIVNRKELNFTYDYYEASDGKKGVHDQSWIKWETIRVQWTNVETGARHYSTLNKEGKATCAGLDGDYKVTLTSLPTGFTYEPNINHANNLSKKISVTVYKIQEASETNYFKKYKDSVVIEDIYGRKLPKTGVYRTTLKNSDDKVLFYYQPSKQGTYSLTTLVDVTENKINPKLTLYTGQVASGAIYFNMEQDGGGSENTYTKNVRLEYNLPADQAKGNALFFELSSTSQDGNDSYPLTVDFLIERDGDYTASYISTTVQVTEDFEKTPEKPEGTFALAHANPVTADKLVSSKTVILNTEEGRNADYLKADCKIELGAQAAENDGYYYFFSYDGDTNTYTLTDRVYAVLNAGNGVFNLTDSKTWPVRYLMGSEDNTKFYNYLQFLDIYREHCNEEDAYPVNTELAKFLQDVCVTYRIFNDGNGKAEAQGYNADEKGMWLIGCGYYRQ